MIKGLHFIAGLDS